MRCFGQIQSECIVGQMRHQGQHSIAPASEGRQRRQCGGWQVAEPAAEAGCIAAQWRPNMSVGRKWDTETAIPEARRRVPPACRHLAHQPAATREPAGATKRARAARQQGGHRRLSWRMGATTHRADQSRQYTARHGVLAERNRVQCRTAFGQEPYRVGHPGGILRGMTGPPTNEGGRIDRACPSASQPGTGEARIAVGGVVNRNDAPSLQACREPRPGLSKKRTEDQRLGRLRHWRHARQAAWAAATQRPEEDGLGLVLSVMPQQEMWCARRMAGGKQGRAAGGTGALLQARPHREVERENARRDPALGKCGCGRRRFSRRLRT